MSRHKQVTALAAVVILAAYSAPTGWAQTWQPVDQYTQDRLSTGTTAERTAARKRSRLG